MSKVVSVVLLLLINLFPFANISYASESCSSMGITYAPNTFAANPSDITLNFQINDSNTASNLQGKYVRLHFIAGGLPFFGDINTEPVQISGNTFQINVLNVTRESHIGTAEQLKSAEKHEAVLDWEPDPKKNYTEFCKDISYFVADADACVIDPAIDKKPPLAIPPATPLDIKFAGKANTEYLLHLSEMRSKSDIKVTTGSDGQGTFSKIVIPGNSGDTTKLFVATQQASNNFKFNCSTEIKIDIRAPKPGPPSDSVPAPGPGAGVVPPGTSVTTPTGTKVCAPGDKTCTLAGGDSCDGGKGIKTAIGCIHTNPLELVGDFMTFVVAVSGGLAFLMMLLGVFQMLTSAGNPETLQAGRDRFQSAIIGLLLVIFAVLLLQIIGADILKIPGFVR